ncbi:MAG: hypothetical protein JSW53_01250 [Candidatus Bathyarchaeota archaeon]|nr:MAG: hypothetical protein JSW53_01250 [Candidatus Bathyarchaeota archaeon]
MTKKLDRQLIKCIDGALREIFGELGAKAIYSYLRDRYSLRREDIPERLETFEKGLKDILSSGAWAAERMALKNLYSNFGLEYRNKTNHRLVDHVSNLKRQV